MPTKVNNAWQTSPQDRQHRALSSLLGEAMARYFITNVMVSDLMFMFFLLSLSDRVFALQISIEGFSK